LRAFAFRGKALEQVFNLIIDRALVHFIDNILAISVKSWRENTVHRSSRLLCLGPRRLLDELAEGFMAAGACGLLQRTEEVVVELHFCFLI
jgi:hypothetical protein